MNNNKIRIAVVNRREGTSSYKLFRNRIKKKLPCYRDALSPLLSPPCCPFRPCNDPCPARPDAENDHGLYQHSPPPHPSHQRPPSRLPVAPQQPPCHLQQRTLCSSMPPPSNTFSPQTAHSTSEQPLTPLLTRSRAPSVAPSDPSVPATSCHQPRHSAPPHLPCICPAHPQS